MNIKGSTRIAGRDAQLMCEVIQVMNGKAEKRTRKYRNSLLYIVLLNRFNECLGDTEMRMKRERVDTEGEENSRVPPQKGSYSSSNNLHRLQGVCSAG